MRLVAPLLLALALLALPLAAGEDNRLAAVGATGGFSSGVMGLQWDDDSALGVRYWLNMTEDEDAVVILTTCMVMDSGNGVYCERHRLVA